MASNSVCDLCPFYLNIRKHKQQLGHKRKSELNGAKIRIRSARCDTAASQGCEGGGGDAAGELSFPIACYYRTNKLQSGTLRSLLHYPHRWLHPVTLGNATRGRTGGSCERQPPEPNHFHKETSAPSELNKLPPDCLRAGYQPDVDLNWMCLLPRSQVRFKLRTPADRTNWRKKGQDKARFERNAV